MMKYALCALLAVVAGVPARAADDGRQPQPSAYQRVMQTQYAAKAAPLPARPEEAQRIYDTYLRSIGQPAKDPDTNSGSNAGVSAH
jgi:hypothetical protein